MDTFSLLLTIAAGVTLFLFGIESFSREVQVVAGERFRKFVARGTRNRLIAFLLGGLVTAIIQSSTATSVITVGLVNAGALSFRQSLGVVFGANVGTTVTAQLVAFQITDFAPLLILLGFAAGYLPFRFRVLGRSIFYFGLVFFSLDLVATAVEPFRSDARVLDLLGSLRSPIAGVVAGAVFTALVQSSSVTTGVALILLRQGVVEFDAALPLILGANIGTTVTALIASATLDTSARRTALSHVLYNVSGTLLFLPFLGPFQSLLELVHDDPVTMLANAHLAFNTVTAGLFLALLGPFGRLVERIVKDDGDEAPLEPAPPLTQKAAEDLERTQKWIGQVTRRVERYYIAAVLAIETRDRTIESRATRTAAIIRYALQEGQELVYRISRATLSEEQSKRALHLVITLDHVRQLLDSVDDLMGIDKNLRRRSMRLSLEALLDVQRVYPRTTQLLAALNDTYVEPFEGGARVRAHEAQLASVIHECYQHYIELAQQEREGTDLADFLSIHQRLRSKITAFAGHLGEHY